MIVRSKQKEKQMGNRNMDKGDLDKQIKNR